MAGILSNKNILCDSAATKVIWLAACSAFLPQDNTLVAQEDAPRLQKAQVSKMNFEEEHL